MNNKKILLSEKQKLKRKEMLLKMKNEIEELKLDINNSKKANLKNNMIRKLKISLRTGQLIAPYVLTAGIIFKIFSLLGYTPFIFDERKKELNIKKDIDNLGNIYYEKQYNDFENSLNTISYVGKWYKESDGLYSRMIKIYSAEKIEEKMITKIINNSDILSLEEVFGTPISTKIETKNNITEEERKNKSFLKSILYSKDSNEFIIIKESLENNISTSILYFLATMLAGALSFIIRSECSSFDFNECINEIKEDYPLIDIEELKLKLKIRQNNYNRLMR